MANPPPPAPSPSIPPGFLAVTVLPPSENFRIIIPGSSDPIVRTVGLTLDGYPSTPVAQVNVIGNPVAGLSISPASMSLSLSGTNEVQIFPTVLPSNAFTPGVIFISTNPAVATVDSQGHVLGIAHGVCNVNVTTIDGGFRQVCSVTVNP